MITEHIVTQPGCHSAMMRYWRNVMRLPHTLMKLLGILMRSEKKVMKLLN